MMDGSREYDLFVRQQPKQARMCGVGGMPVHRCVFFFFLLRRFVSLFILYVFFFFRFFQRHPLGSPGFADRSPQPIVDPSTLRPSCNCASSIRTCLPRLRRRPRRNISSRRSRRTLMPTLATLLVPWTPPCSPPPDSVLGRSSRTRTTSCLPALRNPTTTRSCIG